MLTLRDLSFIWTTAILIPSNANSMPTQFNDSFNIRALSKEEICSARHSLKVNPKYIPEMSTSLNICVHASVGNSSKQETLVRLFDSATPVVHKAFFDSRTGLKDVASFTKIKKGFIEMIGEGFYRRVLLSRQYDNEQLVIYSPQDDQGSYVIEEDIRLCSKLLNCNRGVKSVIKSAQLPRVAKSTQTITFPTLNITIGTTSDDVPYLVLDTYVLATRCLSLTNMLSETADMMRRRLIILFKEKVMPFVEPDEFERAYSRIMSTTKCHDSIKMTNPEQPSIKDQRHSQFPQLPFKFELNLEFPHADEDGSPAEEMYVQCIPSQRTSTIENECTKKNALQEKTTCVESYSEAIAGWTLKEPFGLSGNVKPIEVIHEKGSIVKDFVVACQDKFSIAAFILTAAVCGCLLTLAAVIFCIVRGWCGYVTIWPKSDYGYDVGADDFYNSSDYQKYGDSQMIAKPTEGNWKDTTWNEERTQDIGNNTEYQKPIDHLNNDQYDETYREFSSDESTEGLVIPNQYPQPHPQRVWGRDHMNPSFCAFTDSNQVEVLATLHKRCEVLSKRICDVVREISNDSILEGSPSIESLRKFVRSVSYEVVHDGDTISHLRSTSRDPV